MQTTKEMKVIINHKIKQVINNEGQKGKERQMGRLNAPHVVHIVQ